MANPPAPYFTIFITTIRFCSLDYSTHSESLDPVVKLYWKYQCNLASISTIEYPQYY